MKRLAPYAYVAVASMLIGAVIDRALVSRELERMRGYVVEAMQQYVDCYVASEARR